jgi:hypothetical protein
MGWPTKLRPSPAMVVALIALFVSGGGVGYAASTIGSAQIKNNSVKSKDIKNKTITKKDINSKSLKALKGDTGAKGPQGPAGAAGSALAYGVVSGPTGAVVAAKSKGITASKLGSGVYCVKAPGISPATHPILVSPDFNDGNGLHHIAQYSSQSPAATCTDQGGWGIRTADVAANGTPTDTDLGFSVVIP